MEALGRYILSVTAAAILLGMLQVLVSSKSGSGALVRLIGGLFLTFTMIAPIADMDLDAALDMPWDFTVQGSSIAAQGQAISQAQLQGIIKEQCEAYILDKAKAYEVQLEVEVTLSSDEIPVPASVRLQGSVSPYAKSGLMQWLQDDMGIPRENQLWIG